MASNGFLTIQHTELRQYVTALFSKLGYSNDDGAAIAEALVWSNLRGVDSHGVLRIPWLTRLTETGQMNTQAKPTVLKRRSATALIEADRAPGAVAAAFAMREAIAMARQNGLGWCVVRNMTSPLALGCFSRLACAEGMVGIIFVSGAPNMAPHGAKAPGLHNSPISFAVPSGAGKPIVLDMATSIAAQGKIDAAKDKGIPIPEGWALDKTGTPTLDPKQASIMLPVGGPKGSGLSLMFECLSGLFAGEPIAEPRIKGVDDPRHRQNGVFAAIDVNAFTELGEYQQRVSSLGAELKNLPQTDDAIEVMLPGEPEDRTYDQRLQNGIPLPEETVRKITAIGEKFGLKFPTPAPMPAN